MEVGACVCVRVSHYVCGRWVGGGRLPTVGTGVVQAAVASKASISQPFDFGQSAAQSKTFAGLAILCARASIRLAVNRVAGDHESATSHACY